MSFIWKHISIADYDGDEPPEDLLDTLEGHLKCIDGNIRLVIDYGAHFSHNADETQRAETHTAEIFERMGRICGCNSPSGNWQW